MHKGGEDDDEEVTPAAGPAPAEVSWDRNEEGDERYYYKKYSEIEELSYKHSKLQCQDTDSFYVPQTQQCYRVFYCKKARRYRPSMNSSWPICRGDKTWVNSEMNCRKKYHGRLFDFLDAPNDKLKFAWWIAKKTGQKMERAGYLWNMVIGTRLDSEGMLTGNTRVVFGQYGVKLFSRPHQLPIKNLPEFRVYKPSRCGQGDMCCLAWYPGILENFENETIFVARQSCDRFGGGTYLCQKNATSLRSLILRKLIKSTLENLKKRLLKPVISEEKTEPLKKEPERPKNVSEQKPKEMKKSETAELNQQYLLPNCAKRMMHTPVTDEVKVDQYYQEQLMSAPAICLRLVRVELNSTPSGRRCSSAFIAVYRIIIKYCFRLLLGAPCLRNRIKLVATYPFRIVNMFVITGTCAHVTFLTFLLIVGAAVVGGYRQPRKHKNVTAGNSDGISRAIEDLRGQKIDDDEDDKEGNPDDGL
ncbi:unnamed protein product [Gongylonema pulchrum]|uniref:DUF4776 domain-containing protein n=1 Tax=Gongylonema pulchrum TaxID=637853 RepID=A0A183CX15_9BILA|nr:unnamed protein product [Gongylonema pulchrum]